MIMFNGGWGDFIPSVITGGLGFTGLIYLHRIVKVKFFSECLSSLIIGLMAITFVKLGIGNELDKIIIGSVMPLVPGLLITNAVRDLMAGHLVSGISKGAEAFFFNRLRYRNRNRCSNITLFNDIGKSVSAKWNR